MYVTCELPLLKAKVLLVLNSALADVELRPQLVAISVTSDETLGVPQRGGNDVFVPWSDEMGLGSLTCC